MVNDGSNIFSLAYQDVIIEYNNLGGCEVREIEIYWNRDDINSNPKDSTNGILLLIRSLKGCDSQNVFLGSYGHGNSLFHRDCYPFFLPFNLFYLLSAYDYHQCYVTII